jgi:hypothetical protein
MYEMLRRSTEPYRRICEQFEFANCPHSLAKKVKDAFDASAMRAIESAGKLPGVHKRVKKVQSAGSKKWDEDYGFGDEIIDMLTMYTENGLPAKLVEHLMCLGA